MADIVARFQEIIRTIPIPDPWDRSVFVSSVAEYRGRDIHVRRVDAAALVGTGCGEPMMPSGQRSVSTGSGVWIARDSDDLILFAADTEWHADQVVLHEIGHMLLGHGEEVFGDQVGLAAEPLQALMPSLSMESIKSVLGRSNYSLDRECEAETFADLAMVEAMLPRRRPSVFRSTFFRTRHR